MITATYKIRGTMPLLMCNGEMANPLSNGAKQLKQITSKRNKVDADHEELLKLKWHFGLWVNSNQKVIIPRHVIFATIVNGAKKNKNGKDAQSGMFCLKDSILQYEGPSSIEELWNDSKFRDVRLGGIQKAKVLIMRPKFDPWSADLTIDFDESVVNNDTIKEAIKKAGIYCGIGDGRTLGFGRFELIS